MFAGVWLVPVRWGSACSGLMGYGVVRFVMERFGGVGMGTVSLGAVGYGVLW